jgi:hypothetical protein
MLCAWETTARYVFKRSGNHLTISIPYMSGAKFPLFKSFKYNPEFQTIEIKCLLIDEELIKEQPKRIIDEEQQKYRKMENDDNPLK